MTDKVLSAGAAANRKRPSSVLSRDWKKSSFSLKKTCDQVESCAGNATPGGPAALEGPNVVTLPPPVLLRHRTASARLGPKCDRRLHRLCDLGVYSSIGALRHAGRDVFLGGDRFDALQRDA